MSLPSLRSWSSYSRSPSLPSPFPLMSIREVSNIDDRKVSLPTWRKGELIGLRSCFFCEKSTFSLKGAKIALPPLKLSRKTGCVVREKVRAKHS
jgi:hypothetical protein